MAPFFVGRVGALAAAAFLALMAAACGGNTPATTTPVTTTAPAANPGPTASSVRDDASLFQLITQTEPFGANPLFPNVDEFTTGRLNGSAAHRPVVRVSLNARALSALQNGRLPAGSRFPDGSILVKQVRSSAGAPDTLYAVMYRDGTNTLAGNGWVWAEFGPSGSVAYSVSNRGAGCTGCHLLERGPQNDLVRTFERQP